MIKQHNQKNQMKIHSFDERRDYIVPGDEKKTIQFSIENFVELAAQSISRRGSFFVALSGGTTPKTIYEGISKEPYASKIDWKNVWVFWSDERAVPPDNPDSNYHMAMEAGLKDLPIPSKQIFRMKGEKNIQTEALEYDKIIQEKLNGVFDFVMLGIGDDGHTASLFPQTHGLHAGSRLVVANFVPKMDVWRMSLTFDCINHARTIAIYALGKKKASILHRIFNDPYDPDILPVQAIGTPANKALYILDQSAASQLDLEDPSS